MQTYDQIENSPFLHYQEKVASSLSSKIKVILYWMEQIFY